MKKIVDFLKVLYGGKLRTRDIVKLVVFVGACAFFTVGFSLKMDSEMRRVEVLTKEVKDLRYQSMTLSSKYMNEAKQSNVIQKVREAGLQLKELTEAPRIIYFDE